HHYTIWLLLTASHPITISTSYPIFSLLFRRPPISTLFPYTTLFRSFLRREFLRRHSACAGARARRRFHRPARSRPIENLAGRNRDRKSTRLNSSHGSISYAVFCLKKKN